METPCELFMLAGIAHKIPNHVCGGINKRRGGFNNSLYIWSNKLFTKFINKVLLMGIALVYNGRGDNDSFLL